MPNTATHALYSVDLLLAVRRLPLHPRTCAENTLRLTQLASEARRAGNLDLARVYLDKARACASELHA